MFVETIRLQGKKGLVPVEPDFRIPLGQADIKRPGKDVTLISYGRGVHRCAGRGAKPWPARHVSAEVVDLRTLVPLDVDTMVESVRRTRRAVVVHDAVRFAGPGAEVAAILQAELFGELAAPGRAGRRQVRPQSCGGSAAKRRCTRPRSGSSPPLSELCRGRERVADFTIRIPRVSVAVSRPS